MATIIDALIVSLGLDAKDFKKGTADTTKALDATRRQADESAAAVTKSQNKAQTALQTTGGHATTSADAIVTGANRSGSAFRSLDVRASTAAKSVAAAGKTMLEPFAQLAFGLGTAAIGIDAIQKAISGSLGMAPSDAATGRVAAQYGIPLKEFSAWGNAVGSFGGDATAAQGTLASIAQQQANARLTGEISPAMQMLYSFGINPQEDPVQIMKDLAASPRFRGLSPAAQTTVAQGMLGFDSGSTQLIEKGPAAVAAALAAGSANGMTDQQFKSEQQIVSASNELWQSFRNLGRDIDVDLAPGLVKFLTSLTQFVNWLDNKFPQWFHDNFSNKAIVSDIHGVTDSSRQYSAGQHASIDQGMAALTAAGLTPAQAAGVLGNAQAESSFNLEPSVNPSNPHYGMFQWSEHRRQAILTGTGIDVSKASAAQQYKAALWEMNNDSSLAPLKRAFKSNPNMTPQQAAQLWNDSFERPGGYNPARGDMAANIFGAANRGANVTHKQAAGGNWSAVYAAILRAHGSNAGARSTIENHITVNAPSGDAHHIAKTIVAKLAQHQGSVSQAGGNLS
jgi:hypothetical protein